MFHLPTVGNSRSPIRNFEYFLLKEIQSSRDSIDQYSLTTVNMGQEFHLAQFFVTNVFSLQQ